MFVPWASFVLQMAVLIISMREDELYDGETRIINVENEFSFARISPDGATEACRALQQNLGLQVRKDRSGKETIKEPFSKTIEMIWQTLSNVGTGMESAKSQLQKSGHVTPKYLHGVDVPDVAQMEHSMRIKQVEVNQPWTSLTSDNR
jgi:hypothetical protein